jgi:hypothetical protein
MAELMRNPHVMKRAQDELRDKLNRCPAQIPEGDAEAASAGTSAHPEGVVKDPRVRRAQGHHGACERLGHRQGPRVLGRRRGVQAGAVRVRRSRLQGHGLGVRALWCGEKDMPRNRVRLGHHGARARGSALPLRLGAHGRADAGRAPHDRGDGHHRSEEERPVSATRRPRAASVNIVYNQIMIVSYKQVGEHAYQWQTFLDLDGLQQLHGCRRRWRSLPGIGWGV